MTRKKREIIGGTIGEWVLTYGDVVTLVLCFFVALFQVSESETIQTAQFLTELQNIGVGAKEGGQTLSTGKLADLGNQVDSLPSTEKGRVLGTALKKATSLFQPEIKSTKVRVSTDERGLVISLASDGFFKPASAVVDIEATRAVFVKLAELLKSPEIADRTFRVEGHTDSAPVGADGPWKSNWELSAQRAINTLYYLVAFGADERRFQVSGFADTVPLASNDTEEGRAYNRRIDVIVLDPGHL